MGKKYSANESFFDSWTQEMAYLLGLWYADGSVEYAPSMRGHYIRLGSTDRFIVETAKHALEAEHSITMNIRGRNKPYYVLRIGSKKLFESLGKHGVHERKSKSVEWPNIPKAYLASFIRGYFDGDGCVYLEAKQTKTKRLTTAFTCANSEFLTELRRVLFEEAGMDEGRKIHQTSGLGTAYQLRYSTRDSIRLFLWLYTSVERPLYLSRKYDIFMRYFSERELNQTNVLQVLNQRGPVVKR